MQVFKEILQQGPFNYGYSEIHAYFGSNSPELIHVEVGFGVLYVSWIPVSSRGQMCLDSATLRPSDSRQGAELEPVKPPRSPSILHHISV